MAQRPAFGALKKTKPTQEAPTTPVVEVEATAKPAKPDKVQTSVRLDPPLWAALNDLASRKRVETGRRVTVHDLMIEGARHMLAVNGVKVAE